MNSQPIFTPEIKPCWCGGRTYRETVSSERWFGSGLYIVRCSNGHTFSKSCGSLNRAVHRWNNRMTEPSDAEKADQKEIERVKRIELMRNERDKNTIAIINNKTKIQELMKDIERRELLISECDATLDKHYAKTKTPIQSNDEL